VNLKKATANNRLNFSNPANVKILSKYKNLNYAFLSIKVVFVQKTRRRGQVGQTRMLF